MGNVPQRIRWLLHRFVLRQSMSYFQDEFAGRIGANMMQTALAVRDTAMKVLNVLNYVAFYFAGAVVLAALNDWRLAIPFLVWLCGYGLLLRYFIPRMADVSEKQAAARSLMTGRIVDAYTNISTVKLFSHSSREEVVRQGGDGGVPADRLSADAARDDPQLRALHPQYRAAGERVLASASGCGCKA